MNLAVITVIFFFVPVHDVSVIESAQYVPGVLPSLLNYITPWEDQGLHRATHWLHVLTALNQNKSISSMTM